MSSCARLMRWKSRSGDFDRFVGQFQCVDFGELVLKETHDLVGRELGFAGQAFTPGDELAPRAVAFLVRGQRAARPRPNKSRSSRLAVFPSSSRRGSRRAVKIDPVLSEALQRRQPWRVRRPPVSFGTLFSRGRLRLSSSAPSSHGGRSSSA